MDRLFLPPSEAIRLTLDALPALIDRVFPLQKRFLAGLPRDVAELSRLLTSGRGERNESYLGEPRFLSAYLRYFFPWNICRLVRLLPALPLPLVSGSAITDLGSGPLTFAAALWISRPELRNIPLEFHCLDRTAPVLDAGKTLFQALSGGASPWTIKTIKASFGQAVRFPRADLVTALNLFNELFWNIPWADRRALAMFTEKNARHLSALALDSGSILVIEPGIPRCGEFLSLLRTVLSERTPHAPCPHAGPCPMPGGKAGAKWCHFVFDAGDAPAALHRLSTAAGLPKERAALSFLLAGPGVPPAAKPVVPEPAPQETLRVRIISDPFPLPGGTQRGPADRYGRYGCSARGLVLVCGKRGAVEQLESGDLVQPSAFLPPVKESSALLPSAKMPLAKMPKIPAEQRDQKSGALILELGTPGE